ncbi:SDR family NAD(P)-dependent oxidoreductase [Tsukamurella ocularis]|uniref:SDR family NAD(P)-dependent oxidoreductase n=1 Tax=Tsukamurella ocularis TaxID=1970234 RepID=UPI002166D551|nr:SDR family oxidoreductase [Tsukamurella ocularis]MCS3780014.1 NAD(P)-dependent dehydrogenase (short-subunit alcohol dehydrogenase family) [Tsukamurella ocularis]MCS3788586.1 NAD(P)-dependent dehydrogenase (short-subunit alcohol dehydrogenase family) [Tsukamurella ocularis]MCS3849796.1 NAD(P)-dependent dehydrogenase (short-subunit alcohol dehydrogenase family) [Tsukamurella ocularis]
MSEQQTAVVVGGSTGIGRGIADSWAASGFETHVFSRSRPTGDGSELLQWHRLDFRDLVAAQAVLAAELPDRIDVACYSSIYFTLRRENFVDVVQTDWLDQFDINVHGLFLTLRATLPALRRAAPGLFLHVSSEVVYNAGPGRAGYTATKAAASALIDSVAEEIDPAEVNFVQTLPVGMVDSPGIRARRPADFDYSDYMIPADFGPLAAHLAATRGRDHASDVLVVHEDRTWASVTDGVPVSQSRPLTTQG